MENLTGESPVMLESFEDTSNLFGGKGKARRQARKAVRQEKRKEKKEARHEKRAERQQSRQKRKSTRQETRQLRKKTRVAHRLERKDMRAVSKANRKALRHGSEKVPDDMTDGQLQNDAGTTMDSSADTATDNTGGGMSMDSPQANSYDNPGDASGEAAEFMQNGGSGDSDAADQMDSMGDDGQGQEGGGDDAGSDDSGDSGEEESGFDGAGDMSFTAPGGDYMDLFAGADGNSLRKRHGKHGGHGKHRRKHTKVDESLNAETSDNKIVVPPADGAKSSADGGKTGIIALDEMNDYDVPPPTEIFLGADGAKTMNINWTAVAIGAGLAVVAIWAVKKYKVFGK